MSEFADYADRLNIREQIIRIDRAIEEAAKFRAERDKLSAEREKMGAERDKLSAEREKMGAERDKLAAEAAKLARDRAIIPWQVVATIMGAGAAMFGAGIAFWRVVGG